MNCTRVAPVELSIDPCISLTMTNTFLDYPDYPKRSHRHMGNTKGMLIFLRINTFCQFFQGTSSEFDSDSKAECNPKILTKYLKLLGQK